MSRGRSQSADAHARFMRLALAEARKGLWKTSPNPVVGALIIKNGRVVAKGYHRRAGSAHAEIEAIKAAGSRARGATLYVTLEPCSTSGRTPPCTDAIISSGIECLVIGSIDPNPEVHGRGVKALKRAGIEVEVGVLEKECIGLNVPYAKYITTGTPFVTLKLAVSLDGRIAATSGESKWITGAASRAFVHRLRSRSDAVMVGSATLLADDPELTVRHSKGPNPRPIVLDSELKIPLSSKVFNRGISERAPIIFTTRAAGEAKRKKAGTRGATVITVPRSKDGVDIHRVLKELGKLEVTTLLVEGGGVLAASLLKGRLVDKVLFFIAPVLLGADAVSSVGEIGLKALSGAPRLKKTSIRRLGEDILVEGYL